MHVLNRAVHVPAWLDVEQLTVARSYATALFEIGGKTGEHDAMVRALASVNAVIGSDRRIRDFLRSPKIEVGAKKRVLTQTFGGRLPRLFVNFLLVVLDKRRQRLLDAIAREYDRLLDEQLGRLNVAVTLAREPDAAALTDITTRLSKSLARSVILHVRVDPEILGGVIMRYGDHVLDGSLRRRLLHLRGQLMAAPLSDAVTR